MITIGNGVRPTVVSTKSRDWRRFVTRRRITSVDDAVAARVIPAFVPVDAMKRAVAGSRRVDSRSIDASLIRLEKRIRNRPDKDLLIEARRRTMKLDRQSRSIAEQLEPTLNLRNPEQVFRIAKDLAMLAGRWEADDPVEHEAIDFGDDLRVSGHVVLESDIEHLIARDVFLTPGEGLLDFQASHFLLTCRSIKSV